MLCAFRANRLLIAQRKSQLVSLRYTPAPIRAVSTVSAIRKGVRRSSRDYPPRRSHDGRNESFSRQEDGVKASPWNNSPRLSQRSSRSNTESSYSRSDSRPAPRASGGRAPRAAQAATHGKGRERSSNESAWKNDRSSQQASRPNTEPTFSRFDSRPNDRGSSDGNSRASQGYKYGDGERDTKTSPRNKSPRASQEFSRSNTGSSYSRPESLPSNRNSAAESSYAGQRPIYDREKSFDRRDGATHRRGGHKDPPAWQERSAGRGSPPAFREVREARDTPRSSAFGRPSRDDTTTSTFRGGDRSFYKPDTSEDVGNDHTSFNVRRHDSAGFENKRFERGSRFADRQSKPSRFDERHGSTSNHFEGNSRFADGERPPRPFKAPPTIPYTTPASEFLYGTSVVTAALKAEGRKLYNLYIYQGENRTARAEDESIMKLSHARGVRVKQLDTPWTACRRVGHIMAIYSRPHHCPRGP
jgi:hypothetical protein